MAITLTLASLGAELGSVSVEPSWTQGDVLEAAGKAGLWTDPGTCLRKLVLPDGTLWTLESTVEQAGLTESTTIHVVKDDRFLGSWRGSNFPGTWACIGRFCEVKLDLAADGKFDLCVSGIYHDPENEFNKHHRGIFFGTWVCDDNGVSLTACSSGDGVASLKKEGIEGRVRYRERLDVRDIDLKQLLTGDSQILAVPIHSSSPVQLSFCHTAGWSRDGSMILTHYEGSTDADMESTLSKKRSIVSTEDPFADSAQSEASAKDQNDQDAQIGKTVPAVVSQAIESQEALTEKRSARCTMA